MTWTTYGNNHIHINMSAGTHTGSLALDLTLPKEEKMTNYQYTDEWSGWSSAIDEALYDAPTSTFYVMLESGSVYVYNGVPQSVWNEFKRALSKGRFYAKSIKPTYGPGTPLSGEEYADVVERDNSVPATDMGPVTVGTPKGLSYSSAATVDGKPVNGTAGATTTYNLVTNIQPALLKDVLDHEVRFTVGETLEVKKYTVPAKSVTEAVGVVNEIADALGLEFRVKEVCVHFES